MARSYGDADALVNLKTLTPCVGLQRWVLPREVLLRDFGAEPSLVPVEFAVVSF